MTGQPFFRKLRGDCLVNARAILPVEADQRRADYWSSSPTISGSSPDADQSGVVADSTSREPRSSRIIACVSSSTLESGAGHLGRRGIDERVERVLIRLGLGGRRIICEHLIVVGIVIDLVVVGFGGGRRG